MSAALRYLCVLALAGSGCAKADDPAAITDAELAANAYCACTLQHAREGAGACATQRSAADHSVASLANPEGAAAIRVSTTLSNCDKRAKAMAEAIAPAG